MSSLNLNKVILAGHLAETPELKQTTSGIAVCELRIMVNRKKRPEEEKAIADGFTAICWRQQAEFVCRYFRKGSAICITGALQTRSYTDKQTNQKRYVTEIVADEVNFVDSASGTAQTAQPAAQEAAQQVAQPVQKPETQPQYAQAAPQNYQTLSPDDDLPF